MRSRTGGAGPERGMEMSLACSTAIRIQVECVPSSSPDGRENQKMEELLGFWLLSAHPHRNAASSFISRVLLSANASILVEQGGGHLIDML